LSPAVRYNSVMTTKDFASAYDLTDSDIYEIVDTDDGLLLRLGVNFSMTFVGNHVGTCFDMALFHEFTFVGFHPGIHFKAPIVVSSQRYDDKGLHLTIQDQTLTLPMTDVRIRANVARPIDSAL